MIVKEYNIFEKGINAIVVTVGLLLCIWTATTMKATVATAIGLIPFLLTFIFICIKRPTILLCITFIINYIIMGINRYYPIPIPITNIFDLLFGIMLTLIILKQVYTDDDNRKNAMNAYTFVLLGWLLYCIINAGNGITGELYPEAWLRIKTLGHLSVAHMFHSIHTLQPLFFSALFSDSVGNIHLVGCYKRLLAKEQRI